MISMLPVLGLLFGALWLLEALLLRLLVLANLFGAVLLLITPWALSGHIHLDGFMDCSDAIMSRRDLQEKQRILKDPHAGSFAVISLVILALLELSLLASWDWAEPLPLLLIPAVSRSCSALAVNILKPIGHSSYAGRYLEDKKRGANALPLLVLIAAAILSFPLGAGAAALAAAAGSFFALLYGSRQLGGMSGDVSGYAITIGECSGLLCMVLQSRIAS
jgi:adenosylcobinamide-GDP ribazoletransferase